jgi:hypothetical protein
VSGAVPQPLGVAGVAVVVAAARVPRPAALGAGAVSGAVPQPLGVVGAAVVAGAARVPRPAALGAGAVPGLVGLVVPRAAAVRVVSAVVGALPLAAVPVVSAALAGLGVLLPARAAPRVVLQPARQAAPPN